MFSIIISNKRKNKFGLKLWVSGLWVQENIVGLALFLEK
jgi:hypothetical protein